MINQYILYSLYYYYAQFIFKFTSYHNVSADHDHPALARVSLNLSNITTTLQYAENLSLKLGQ